MTCLSSAIVIFLVSASINTAQAQGVSALVGQSPARQGTPDPADCERLAAMPNPPISVEACKSMMGMATSYNAAATNPDAQREGDDRLTCAQIFAEVQTMENVGVSEVNAAQAEAMVNEGTATARQQAGNIAAFMAQAQLMGLAAGVFSAFTPNFVPNPMLILFQTRLAALTAQTRAEQTHVSARLDQTVPGITGDLSESMKSNPRFGHLMQLAIEKNCEPPQVGAR
jgi:hypothetical protein